MFLPKKKHVGPLLTYVFNGSYTVFSLRVLIHEIVCYFCDDYPWSEKIPRPLKYFRFEALRPQKLRASFCLAYYLSFDVHTRASLIMKDLSGNPAVRIMASAGKNKRKWM